MILKSQIFFRASSEADVSLRVDLISMKTGPPLEAPLNESINSEFSFTTRSYDQMHQYSVIFIILSSGFWQYLVQGLMSQLALGPLSPAQYQINLFWIQQCHLTIGAFHRLRTRPRLHALQQVLFLAAVFAMLAPLSHVCSVVW
jgi:hypothetical protein